MCLCLLNHLLIVDLLDCVPVINTNSRSTFTYNFFAVTVTVRFVKVGAHSLKKKKDFDIPVTSSVINKTVKHTLLFFFQFYVVDKTNKLEKLYTLQSRSFNISVIALNKYSGC